MRRIPISLILAAVVAVTAVVVIIQITVLAPPVVVGENTTATISPGGYVLWYGAGGFMNFTSDKEYVTVYYTMDPAGVVVWAPGGLSAKVLYNAGTYTRTGDYVAVAAYNGIYYLLMYVAPAGGTVVFNLTKISATYNVWNTTSIKAPSALSSICSGAPSPCYGFVRVRFDPAGNAFYMDLVDATGAASSILLSTFSANIGPTSGYLTVRPTVNKYDNDKVWVYYQVWAGLKPQNPGLTYTVKIAVKPPS